MAVSTNTFLSDPQHGARYADVIRHPDFGPALVDVINVVNRADSRRKMTEAVDLYGQPPLAPLLQDAEEAPQVARLAERYSLREMARFKQAVGIAIKYAMDEEGFDPALRSDGQQDQARLEKLPRKPRFFTTARRYTRRPASETAGRRKAR